MNDRTCITCSAKRTGAVFCNRCRRAYDRADIVGDDASIMQWVSRRLRRTERARTRLAVRMARADILGDK